MQNLDKKITEIYNACWLLYKQFIVDRNTRLYTQRCVETREKYKSNFYIDITLSFASIIYQLNNSNIDKNKLEKEVENIYKDCWKSYREFTSSLNQELYWREVENLVNKYNCNFCKNILSAFMPIVDKMYGMSRKEVG